MSLKLIISFALIAFAGICVVAGHGTSYRNNRYNYYGQGYGPSYGGYQSNYGSCSRVRCGQYAYCTIQNGRPFCRCRYNSYSGQCGPARPAPRPQPYNPCANSPCHRYAYCTPLSGRAYCRCNSGYRMVRRTCVLSGGGVAPGIGGNVCSLNCGAYGYCSLQNGIQTCLCNSGYSNVGGTCQASSVSGGGIGGNVCNLNCGQYGYCSLQGGVASCVCNSGYSFNGVTCQQASVGGGGVGGNVCNLNCGQYGYCSLQGGVASCICNSGYSFNGVACQRVSVAVADPCTGVNCGGQGMCVVQSGVASCTCNPGYVYSAGSGCQLVAVQPPASTAPPTGNELFTDPGYWAYPVGCTENICQFEANWQYYPGRDVVRFMIKARVPLGVWAGIGFSQDMFMPNSDCVTGWMTTQNVPIVVDRYLFGRSASQVPPDASQDITTLSLTHENGALMYTFERPRVTGDSSDLRLDMCSYYFFAWGGAGMPNQRISAHTQKFVSPQKICVGTSGSGDMILGSPGAGQMSGVCAGFDCGMYGTCVAPNNMPTCVCEVGAVNTGSGCQMVQGASMQQGGQGNMAQGGQGGMMYQK